MPVKVNSKLASGNKGLKMDALVWSDSNWDGEFLSPTPSRPWISQHHARWLTFAVLNLMDS